MKRTLAVIIGVMLATGGVGRAATPEQLVRERCAWLGRALAVDPARDDVFGTYMRGMKPKCQATIEGLDRKDGSISKDALAQLNKDLDDLRNVLESEGLVVPPPAPGPDPATVERERAEKAAAEKAAAEKAAAEKAAAEKAAADKAAADKAAAEKAAADKAAADRAAADKAAKEQAERDAKGRAALDKKEAARLEAEAKAQAERERKAAEKAEAEAKAQAERERKAAEKAEAEAKAQAERDREAAADQAAADAARAREEAEAEARQRALVGEAAPRSTAPRADRGVTGTWTQDARKVLDRNEKRTLNLFQKGDSVEGEIFEETWMPAPSDWVHKSCGGNTTFRMVTSARVSGERKGREVHLRRDVPRVLACTCPSRCAAEQRRRGLDLALSPSGQQLTDSAGTFVLDGAVAAGEAAVAAPSGAPAFAGSWESRPFDRRGVKMVVRLELEAAGKKLVGTLAESADAALPLATWADRFCDGAQRFQHVTTYAVAGSPDKRELTLERTDAAVLTCSCPSKCRAPTRPRPITLSMTADGTSLMYGDAVLERR